MRALEVFVLLVLGITVWLLWDGMHRPTAAQTSILTYWHDDSRAVSCWYGPGVSCLPDAEVAVQRVTVIQPNDATVKDAFTWEYQPTTVFGDPAQGPGHAVKLFIGAYGPGAEFHSFLKFSDLTSIPKGAVIDNATVSIKQTWCNVVAPQPLPGAQSGCDGSTIGVSVFMVTSDWDEKTITWNTEPTRLRRSPDAVSDSNRGSVVTVQDAVLTLDVTTIMRLWQSGQAQNYGLEFQATPPVEPGVRFFRGRSHDWVADWQEGLFPASDGPKLTVTWH